MEKVLQTGKRFYGEKLHGTLSRRRTSSSIRSQMREHSEHGGQERRCTNRDSLAPGRHTYLDRMHSRFGIVFGHLAIPIGMDCLASVCASTVHCDCSAHLDRGNVG